MDGTLLNNRHELSKDFIPLFKRLKQKGIVFTAASGRQYDSIVDKLQMVKDEIYVIAENGGVVKHLDHELLSTPFPTEFTNNVIAKMSEYSDIHTVLCTKKGAFIRRDQKDFLSYVKEYYTSISALENLNDLQEEIIKIALYHKVSSEKHIYPHVKSYEANLQVKVSGPNWVDISHIDCNKGFALKKLQSHLGIGSEETLVIGDYNNDLEMMQQSHYSFAMANSHPNVLKAAKYRTASNEEQGVEKVLEKILKDI
jgi:Cof subfamily protein (haloacid dehalogenase superfamily)